MNHLPDMLTGEPWVRWPPAAEVQAHESVAGIEQRQEHGLVHLAAGIGLDIGEAGAEQLLGALDRQGLDHIDKFAAAIIALAGIAFGIFVGQDRALGFQHRFGDDVLGSDQLDLVLLALQFVGDASAISGSACARLLLKNPEIVPLGALAAADIIPPLLAGRGI